MNRLLDHRLGPMIGWPGLIGIGLWAICLMLFVALVQPARLRLDEMRDNAESLQARLGKAGQLPQGGTPTTEGQLAEFYRIFPDSQATADLVGGIARIAQRHGLGLDQGDYKATPDPFGRLTRLQITLPLKGTYQQIRGCLATLGREMPIVALEQVQFERQKVGDGLVDARLRLVLFLGRAP
jgi:hypothetical protein